MMNRININSAQVKDELNNLAHAAISSAFKSLFSDVEKKLFSRAEHTIDQEDKTEYFELIASLKGHIQQFETDFFTSAKSMALHQSIPKNWVDLAHDRTLGLMIEDMIGHSKARYGMEHAQYESRIKLLNQAYPETIPERFYTLPAIVAAFLLNIKAFKKPLKKDITRVLGNQVLIKLEPLYMLMNDHLVQLGVLPQIKTVRGNDFSDLENIFNDMFDRDSILGVMNEAAAHEEIVDPIPVLQDLLKRKRLILRKASSIQPDDFTDSFITVVEKYHKQASSVARLASKDKEIIRLVGAVIADIINDNQINPVIKKQVHLLQTILLYTAFEDANFFSQINNPARSIINELAVIGSDPTLDIDKIINIESLITDIVQESSQLIFTFAPKLRELYRIDGRVNKDGEISVSAMENRHPEVLARCRERIGTHIKGKVRNEMLATPTQKFIEEVWAPFLVHILMTHGRQCDEWQEANVVLDGVISLTSLVDGVARDPSAPMGGAKVIIELESRIKNLLKHSSAKIFQSAQDTPAGSAIQGFYAHLDDLKATLPPAPSVAAAPAPITNPEPRPEPRLPPSNTPPNEGIPAAAFATTESITQRPPDHQIAVKQDALIAAVAQQSVPAETTQVETTQVETAQVETTQVETTQVETTQVETTQVETTQVETTQVETAQVEAAQVEAAQVEAAQVEAAQVEAAQVEAAQIEAAQVVTTPAETAQTEKPDSRTADIPHADGFDDVEASPYAAQVKNPKVLEFFTKNVLSDEWFQVFTTEGAALRRLKVSTINFELGIVNFSNRNGELALFLPLAQVFRDIVEQRSHPVFDNAQFNSAREKLIHELSIVDI